MFKIEEKIPDLLTICNLICGVLAVFCCFSGGDTDFYGYSVIVKSKLSMAGYLIFAGAVFDVLDGLAARLLKVNSKHGKQLDSLADVITFGLAPTSIVYVMLLHSHQSDWFLTTMFHLPLIALLSLAIVVGAAIRLAVFSSSDNQTKSFIGLPSPAAGIFFASLPIIAQYNTFILPNISFELSPLLFNPILLIGLSLFFGWIMNSSIRMFSFKMSNFTFKDNKLVFMFLGLSLLMLIVLFWLAIPIIIILYILFNIFIKNKNEVQS